MSNENKWINQLLSNHNYKNRKCKEKYFEALNHLLKDLNEHKQIKDTVDSNYEPAPATKILKFDKIRRILND